MKSRAMLLIAAVALGGCWGDGTGYDVRIDNRSSGDVVVTVEGKDQTNDSTVARSFLAGAGAEPAVTSWSYLDFGADGYLPGTVRLFTLDCEPIAEYSVDAGSYIITVESSGTRIVDNGGHFADATPDLPPAPRSCSPALEEPTLGEAPPPLNATESWIVERLAVLGITAMRAEYSFGDSAAMWSRFDDGSELLVSATPVESDRSEPSVMTQREIAGVIVERVDHGEGLIRDRFRCGNLTFSTGGAVPPDYDDFERFLARFIAELDCPQNP